MRAGGYSREVDEWWDRERTIAIVWRWLLAARPSPPLYTVPIALTGGFSVRGRGHSGAIAFVGAPGVAWRARAPGVCAFWPARASGLCRALGLPCRGWNRPGLRPRWPVRDGLDARRRHRLRHVRKRRRRLVRIRRTGATARAGAAHGHGPAQRRLYVARCRDDADTPRIHGGQDPGRHCAEISARAPAASCAARRLFGNGPSTWSCPCSGASGVATYRLGSGWAIRRRAPWLPPCSRSAPRSSIRWFSR